jgi:hypothetical protein
MLAHKINGVRWPMETLRVVLHQQDVLGTKMLYLFCRGCNLHMEWKEERKYL